MNQQRQSEPSATQTDVTDFSSVHSSLENVSLEHGSLTHASLIHEEIDTTAEQYERRFQGTQTLYGDSAFNVFASAHVYVIGIGGVGSWAAEALARTAVGTITLIDLDVLVASNINRQLPALDSTFGQSKIAAMATRIREINPKVKLHLVDDFLTPDNVAALLPSRSEAKAAAAAHQSTVILDCVDDMDAKLAIAVYCRSNKLKLICSGGAGGKIDPLQITASDLRNSYQDPLLASLRNKLRFEKGINSALRQRFRIKCVYSTEPPRTDKSCQAGGLQCGGYGSAVVVTSVIAMVMVSETLKLLTKQVGANTST